jgi:hypothetical protein
MLSFLLTLTIGAFVLASIRLIHRYPPKITIRWERMTNDLIARQVEKDDTAAWLQKHRDDKKKELPR